MMTFTNRASIDCTLRSSYTRLTLVPVTTVASLHSGVGTNFVLGGGGGGGGGGGQGVLGGVSRNSII